MKTAIKISAIVAFLLGLMPVITGSRVLLGVYDPGYNVLMWLVYYNVLMGAVSVYCAFLIWKMAKPALQIASVIAILHIIVLMLLNTLFFDEVASQSINVMMIRAFLWIIVLYILKKAKVF